VTLGTGCVIEIAELVISVAHWERVSVIEEVHLVLLGVAFFSGNKTRVLLVEPRPLHVGLALWIILFVVLLACQFRKALNLLLVEGPYLTSTAVRLVFSEGCLRSGRVRMCWLAKVVTSLCIESSRAVVSGVMRNDCAESFRSSLNRPVCKRQIRNIVLVDHAQDWFLRMPVYLGVLIKVLIHSFHFPEIIVTDQL